MGAIDDFRRHLQEHGLTAWADRLVETERASLRLIPVADGTSVARLGGRPRLRDGDNWPVADAKPLSFIAELDLPLASAALGDTSLAREGMLEFFYDAQQQAWGFDPSDRPRWRVLNVPTDAPLRDFPADLDGDARFKEVRLRAIRESTFAPWESRAVEALGMPPEVRNTYGEALEAWSSSDERERATFHRVMGHPEIIQNEMTLECQLASNGVYVGDTSGYTSEAAKMLEPEADAWRLLLQIDSDDDAGMCWGDVGRLYFWIREPDLVERHWDRVWMILQCY